MELCEPVSASIFLISGDFIRLLVAAIPLLKSDDFAVLPGSPPEGDEARPSASFSGGSATV